jgi:hypothetical protein
MLIISCKVEYNIHLWRQGLSSQYVIQTEIITIEIMCRSQYRCVSQIKMKSIVLISAGQVP